MIINYQELSSDALRGIAEQFILAQLSEVEEQPRLDEWVEQVINKVKSGDLVVEYSLANESVVLKNPAEIKLTELNSTEHNFTQMD